MHQASLSISDQDILGEEDQRRKRNQLIAIQPNAISHSSFFEQQQQR